MRLFEGTLYMSYGQAYIVSNGSGHPMTPGPSNGLCGTNEPGAVFLKTASTDGDVHFTIELLEAAPATDVGSWEEVVEGSFSPLGSPVHFTSWGNMAQHELALPPGVYGYRYCGRGLDEDLDEAFLDEKVQPDEYALYLWPDESRREDTLVKSSSKRGAYWHQAARERKT